MTGKQEAKIDTRQNVDQLELGTQQQFVHFGK